MDIKAGDRVELKKPHPCGNKVFTVLRVGMDFKSAVKAAGARSWCPETR